MGKTTSISRMSSEDLLREVNQLKNRLNDPSIKYYCRRNLTVLLNYYRGQLESKRRLETAKIMKSFRVSKLSLAGIFLLLLSFTSCEVREKTTPNIVKYFDGAYNEKENELKSFSTLLGRKLTRVYKPKYYSPGYEYAIDTISGEAYQTPIDPDTPIRDYLQAVVTHYNLEVERSILHVLYSPSEGVITLIQGDDTIQVIDSENHKDLDLEYSIFITESLYTLDIKKSEYVYLQIDFVRMEEQDVEYVLRINSIAD